MRRVAVGWLLLLLGIVLPPAGVLAQDPRDSLVSRAFNEFDTPRRLQLLMSALNPAAGPPQGAWDVGVQLLAQTLIEEGNDSLAGLWLRWALRLSPNLQIDTVQFVPAVATAFAGARDFVNRTRSPGDSLTATNWLWPQPGTRDSVGRLQVSAPSITSPLQASVEGVGPLASDLEKVLPAGSYVIRAGATGYDNLSVTREVLPAVTTLLELRLQRPLARADQGNREIPEQMTVEPERKKKFPWVIVLAGVAGAGAVVALAGGGSDNPPPPPTTGGITISFPP